ncbi:NDR1/HIN1-like protein 1 [Henckelia pumila]|uniref:NDR1/HIN1-like protein 1 n=1 Tax=Henckelia pumila TaxID=405737 RepID=UPI003C6E37A5
MSHKVCHYHQKSKWRKLAVRFLSGLLISAFIILVVVLIVWAVLKPKPPRFVLQDATIFALNVSAAPNIISTNMQITVLSRNPNSKIGIYYDRMDAYAAYRGQQITFFTAIPPVYQGGKDVDVWSPFVSGNAVPVAPYNGISLCQDQANGLVSVTIKLNGRVRWRVGSFVSGGYHLHVSCLASIPLGNSNNINGGASMAIKYELSQSCSVSV